MPVFFIRSQDIGDGTITITDSLLRHIAKSLRTQPGDPLVFNDDQGHRYHTTVNQITKHQLEATILRVEHTPRPSHPPIILAQALLKGEKMGWVIQKATEMGVSTIIPLLSDRVILKLSGDQRQTHQARWERIALEAAQQSERWNLPAILPIQTFQEFLDRPRLRLPIFMAEREETGSLLTTPLAAEDQAEPFTVCIGPEGGWSTHEIDIAKSRNWAFASFGKKVLRAETASLAALAILDARLTV